LTGGRSGGAFGRIPTWIGQGFKEIGGRFDAVFLDGPPGIETDGGVRTIKLGSRRAARSISAWAKYLSDERPDLAIASPESLAPYAVLAGRRAKARVVPWETSFVTFGLKDFPLVRRLTLPTMQRLTYRFAPWVAAVSTDVAAELNERLSGGRSPERYRLLPNPFVAEPLLGPHPPSAEGRFRLCAVGRLTVHKGYDVLIEAVRRMVEESRDVELLVVGDGPRRSDLERQASSLGGRVKFLGEIRRPGRTLLGSDVFVHPARREGFGIAILEAMAAGLPVVATSCPGGPKDLLDGGRFGVLVPPDDVSALTAALSNLQEDAEMRARLIEVGRTRLEAYLPSSIATLLTEMAS
jgi:glycosyltransferase involved in cell wall biosynthesis